nr:Homeodomain-like [Kibdelosporangium sp. MJ126-NF4]
MIGSLRRELLDRILTVNEQHLRCVLTVYLRHFNTARPHRSLKQLAPARTENLLPTPVDLADYRVRRRPVLDRLTSEYEIAARPKQSSRTRLSA